MLLLSPLHRYGNGRAERLGWRSEQRVALSFESSLAELVEESVRSVRPCSEGAPRYHRFTGAHLALRAHTPTSMTTFFTVSLAVESRGFMDGRP